MKTTSQFLQHTLLVNSQQNLVLCNTSPKKQWFADCKQEGLSPEEIAEHTNRIVSCVNAFKNIDIAPDKFVQDALASGKKNEELLDLLYKANEALQLAIQSTPTGVVRNTLTNTSIKIANALNPELTTIPKLNSHE